MQSATKHLAGDSNPIVATVLDSDAREMLRCALHDRSYLGTSLRSSLSTIRAQVTALLLS